MRPWCKGYVVGMQNGSLVAGCGMRALSIWPPVAPAMPLSWAGEGKCSNAKFSFNSNAKCYAPYLRDGVAGGMWAC